MPKKNAAPASAKEKKKETFPEFISSMAAVLVTGLFIITFNLQAFEIPSSSMEDTLLIGDHVFVDRITVAPAATWAPVVHYRAIRHNDIIVFLHPATPGLFVVKRIIGIPGDRIHLRNGTVYRNGEALNEAYVIRSQGNYNPYRDNFPSVPASTTSNVTPEWEVLQGVARSGEDIVVPPGHYFAMGDNRDVSLDSRYWGFVPRENIIGRPLFIYWSFETPPGQYEKTEITERLSFIVKKVMLHFFDQTRWRRMLHLVR